MGSSTARTSDASPAGTVTADPDQRTDEDLDRPWLTVVWDDPVNLMRYVTYVFQKLFGYSEAKASELMMQVHTEGKAIVSSGGRDKVELDVRKLHAAGLWATMQRDG
ncbi:ATP-dependent Clp protease adapter ClpS [Jongsikchunia kroppenstedtii]|uniref:ATP-dependent Clp protease adapter ClpS n=1 Tax=Jongsikchunia kroppenstedtii TaxID=1121721 RepID=UPI00037B16F0|nr:ATP-dependent Clp protease adapter ClpS [Jongsikchunia kroppenstedtii]